MSWFGHLMRRRQADSSSTTELVAPQSTGTGVRLSRWELMIARGEAVRRGYADDARKKDQT